MPRQPSKLQKNPVRKARPALEGLEDRLLLSSGTSGSVADVAHLPPSGLSHDNRQFTYATPSGGVAVITLMGVGNLTGTYDDSMGLHIEYADTNSFSKIIGKVYGGDGFAPLASIISRHLVDAGAQNSLSGVSGNVLQAVILNQWNLVAGGNINLTSGVNSLVLNSIGPDTQVHLRDIPAEIEPTALVANAQAVAESSNSSSADPTSSGKSDPSFSSSSSSTVSPTLPIGEPTTITNANGTEWTYVLEAKQDLTLTAVSGSFAAQPNEVEPLPTGQPRQTPPPAPPGIILKVNAIYGAPTQQINLLTDPVIWGYDAQTGQLVQFNLNLKTGTGTPDGLTIPVPGAPTVAGVNLGWNGSQLDVLVSSGTEVYAYNATTGAPNGSFSTAALLGPGPIISIGSTDTVTVLDSYGNNSLQMIDLASSLQTGTAQPAAGNPAMFSPSTAQTTFLGGLTSVPGSTTIYGTVSAHFDSFQPDQFQLGIQAANTTRVTHDKLKGSRLTYEFSGEAPTAVEQDGSYVDVTPNPLVSQTGSALGSVDSNLALVTIPSTPGENDIELLNPSTNAEVGQIVLDYADPIVALSGSFRPDLTGSAAAGTGPALIDVQGDIQSIRGREATGMVLNDSGNLNLVKFAKITNSTIVGQPLGHVDVTAHLVNVTMLTPSRTVSTRGGVQVISGLQQIGPLSFTGD